MQETEIIEKAQAMRQQLIQGSDELRRSYEHGLPNSAPAASATKELQALRKQSRPAGSPLGF